MTSYNSIEGIRGYLNNLDDLNRLITERRIAYGKEDLKEFCILGRWIADSCGNFGKILEPKEGLPISGVIYKEDINCRYSWSFTSDIPSAKVPCAYCGECWTVDNCHDVHVKNHSTAVDLKELIGKTLSDVREFYKQKTDAKYLFPNINGYDAVLRNEKYIDKTQNPKYETLKINDKGWVPNTDQPHVKIDDTHIVEEGDFGLLWVWTYYHTECYRKQKAQDDRKYYADIIKKAGFKEFSLKEIPNEYSSHEVYGPWFIAHTFAGPIKIGCRKRVINIDWSGTEVTVGDMFVGENVTQGDGYIHAWGEEKAVEYLSKIRSQMQNQNIEEK